MYALGYINSEGTAAVHGRSALVPRSATDKRKPFGGRSVGPALDLPQVMTACFHCGEAFTRLLEIQQRHLNATGANLDEYMF